MPDLNGQRSAFFKFASERPPTDNFLYIIDTTYIFYEVNAIIVPKNSKSKYSVANLQKETGANLIKKNNMCMPL